VIGPAESKTLSMRESSMPENREIPAAPAIGRKPWKGRSGKACGHNPDAHAGGKSDRPIVPRKLPNKPGATASGAEEVEGRGLAKEKTLRQNPAPRCFVWARYLPSRSPTDAFIACGLPGEREKARNVSRPLPLEASKAANAVCEEISWQCGS
jgi:hypothetical protein